MGTLKVEVYPCMFTDKSIKDLSRVSHCASSYSIDFMGGSGMCFSCPYAVVSQGIGMTFRICSFGYQGGDGNLIFGEYYTIGRMYRVIL